MSVVQGSALAVAIAALAVDPSSCGAASAVPAPASCGDLQTCETDGGIVCTDTQTDNANCGACGVSCCSGHCVAGACGTLNAPGLVVCPSASPGCSGPVEIDPASSAAYCGATLGCGVGGQGSAGNACSSGFACVGGACGLSCVAGLTPCNGRCVPLGATDAGCGDAGP
jgi:hypothetical protein